MKIKGAALLGLTGLVLSGCGGGSTAGPAQAVARCMTCHSFNEGGRQLSGPNLAGIVGKPAGSQPGYNYSAAMKQSGVVWTEDKLDAFIAAPAQVVPGTRMSFAGEPDAAKRKAIIEAMRPGAAN